MAYETEPAPPPPAAPSSHDAPKVHPRARRLSVKSSQPPAREAQQQAAASNTCHVFELHASGKASVCVNDTLELRSAFLSYCGNSSMRPSDMHNMQGPTMSTAGFMNLCKDLRLVEPQGELCPARLACLTG